mmetsp:Transcript_47527/g.100963  ORF Transcript_47527/g.100963 Transcript_47527/m.100963 type:complete len:649 (+) Transcript_47527:221-2167(+)
MGDTISSLVFRPPKPTPIHPSEYFYLDVDVYSPLCTNKTHRQKTDGCIGDEHGSCGSTMCLDTGESDLASLDANYGIGKQSNANTNIDMVASVGSGDYFSPSSANNNNPASPVPSINNVRNGQIYKIPAFFIRRRNATQTLLFSHGNAEDLGMMYNRMKDLAMVLGVNIMAYDYTGYGLSIPGPAHGSQGSGNNPNGGPNQVEGPSENMIYRNIEAAFRYLTLVRNIPPHQIILYGRSLGSGPSCYLAAKSALNGASVGGLILHSPFLSVYKVVADLNGLDLGLVGDLFHNEKRARNVRCPTLIIHGRQDEVVPFWHAPRLLAAVPPEFRAQPFYVDDMGHNHIESRCRERYVRVVLNFLRMGVWNNRNNNATQMAGVDDSYSSGTSKPYRGPSPIPLHERASPSETKENASFYVNKTWLRHAKVLLKEVFVDAGCYVGSAGSCDDSSSRWERNSRSGGATVVSASTSRSRPATTRSVAGSRGSVAGSRAAGGLSDARDDEEDEFAPWRGSGGGGGGFTRSRSLNNPPANLSGSENSSVSGYSRSGQSRESFQQQQQRARSEKILTTRRDDGNNRHAKRPGSLSIGPNTPRHDRHKSESMGVDNMGFNKLSSPRRKSQQQSSHKEGGGGHNRSKSLQLLEGMSRQRRY